MERETLWIVALTLALFLIAAPRRSQAELDLVPAP